MIQGFNQAHELYVSTYELIGSATSTVTEGIWNQLPTPSDHMKDVSREIIGTPLRVAGHVAQSVLTKSIEVGNQVLGRPAHQQCMRSCRSDLKELKKEYRKNLIQLSLLCSKIFEHPCIISQELTRENLQDVIRQIEEAHLDLSYDEQTLDVIQSLNDNDKNTIDVISGLKKVINGEVDISELSIEEIQSLSDQLKALPNELCEIIHIVGIKDFFEKLVEFSLNLQNVDRENTSLLVTDIQGLYSRFKNLTEHRPRVAEATALCHQLIQMKKEIEAIEGEAISSEDYSAYFEALSNNLILSLSVGATLENVGECLGGLVLDEGEGFIPLEYNPATIAANALSKNITYPLGRWAGFSLSSIGSIYLLNKIPTEKLTEEKKRLLQLAVFTSLIAAEYCELNPLSNFLAESFESLGYDFGFYSVCLLSNYLGMKLFGSTEELGSYVRNMTWSMLTYNGVDSLMSSQGYGDLSRFLVSFSLSHVAYNSDTYKSFLSRNFIMDSIDTKDISIFLADKAHNSSRKALTQVVLDQTTNRQIIYSTIKNNFKAISPISLDTIVKDEGARTLINNLKKQVDTVEKNISNEIKKHAKKLDGPEELASLLENSLDNLKPDDELSEIGFLFRMFNNFISSTEKEDTSYYIKEYKKSFYSILNTSEISNLSEKNEAFNRLEDLNSLIAKSMIHAFYEGEEADYIHKLFIESLKKGPKEDFNSFFNDISNSISEYSEQLYPMVPNSSFSEKIYSTHMMEKFSQLFTLYLLLRGSKSLEEPENLREPLSNFELMKFFSQLTKLVLDVRYSEEQRLDKDLMRKFTMLLLNTQMPTE